MTAPDRRPEPPLHVDSPLAPSAAQPHRALVLAACMLAMFMSAIEATAASGSFSAMAYALTVACTKRFTRSGLFLTVSRCATMQ